MPATMKSNRPLKIGLILDTSLDPPDGVQQYVVGIGEWLRSQGHMVHYLVGETHERQLPHIHTLTRNFRVSFNGNRTTIPVLLEKRRARASMQHENFDILHVQTPHHPFMAQRLIMAASNRTGVVATFHILPYGFLARFATKLLSFLLRPSLARIDRMFAVSKSAAKFEMWAFSKPAVVLPNVIDYERFHKAKPFKNPGKELTILFLGRLVERKGCLTLLRAVRELRRSPDAAELPSFKVVICGQGHLLAKLQSYVAQNDLADIVTFAGFVSEEDKPRYYASADISVFPSSSGESFGIVLLEAMASGRAAVLAGDNPGYHSVMESRPDLLFKPTDAKMLAGKLRLVLSDAKQRNEAANWGAKYSAGFDVNVVGRGLVNHYNQVLRLRRNMQ
jgi:phosphatidylinositol alpha-mannosyltransferase